jgi:ferredoxin-NADP reductase
MQLTLAEKKREAADVTSFLFRSDTPLTWRAGHFLRYALPHPGADDRKTTRYFTIASAPFEGIIMLTTRFASEKGSTFKQALQRLPIGATIEVGQPAGDFVVDDPTAEHVFVAGGIGMTPYRAMLLDLDHRGVSIRGALLYANRTPEFVYKDEIEALAKKRPGLTVHYFVSPERISENAIRKAIPEPERAIFYLSGPEPMVEATDGMVADMGIPGDRIKRDYFPGYDWP